MKTKMVLLLAAMMTCLTGQVYAWDNEPDENGLYDELYDRPTYFPDWEQPGEWPNAMYVLCEVRLESAEGQRLESYEIAVYDQENNLRHCSRSLAEQDHYCVLTIRGTEGDTFRFEVISGKDYANPEITEIPGVTLAFETNKRVGSPDEPYLLVIPNTPTANENINTVKTGITYDILGRPVSGPANGLFIRDGQKYIIR